MAMKFRHWVGIVTLIVIYAVWKAYVLYTPSPADDHLPDKFLQEGYKVVICRGEGDPESDDNQDV